MIRHFYRGRTILLTGGTGFYGQGLLAKLLRSLSDIKRIYLPIRPINRPGEPSCGVEQRLSKLFELSPVFDRFRTEDPSGFKAATKKVIAVEGDLLTPDLGLDMSIRNILIDELDVLISCAATVSFDEPLDHSLRLNTLGPCEVLELARACKRSPVFVHVSTAYVNGRRSGDILEEPLPEDRDIVQIIRGDQTPSFDVECEIEDGLASCRQIASRGKGVKKQNEFKDQILRESRAVNLSDGRLAKLMAGHTKRWIDQELIREGMQRAYKHGWHDVYTYTKALGEQLLSKRQGDVPIVVVRPAVTESSLSDPEPGWIHGLKVTDPLVVAYGRGIVPDFPAQRGAPMDLVPIDIVVNSIIISAVKAQKGQFLVYHAATSGENPFYNTDMFQYAKSYFRENPLVARDGSIPELVDWTFPSVKKFRRVFRWRYMFPLEARQWLLDKLPENRQIAKRKRRLAALKTRLKRVLYFVDLFSPYTTIDCRFRMNKMLKVFDNLSDEEQEIFNVDVRCISWKHYYQDVHLPGLRRHVLKEGLDGDTSFV